MADQLPTSRSRVDRGLLPRLLRVWETQWQWVPGCAAQLRYRHTHTHSHTHTHLLRAQRVSRQSKSPKQSMSPRTHVDAARQQHCKTRMRVLSGLRFQGSGWYRDLKTSNWEPSAPSARQARHASASSAVRPSCGQVQGLSNFCFCYTS